MNDHLAKAPRFLKEVPAGDDRERDVCETCGFVNYNNPKVVVGSVVIHDEKILLCRRAIEPRKGYWTLPAGFLENQETAVEGAKREAWEEARAKLKISSLLAVYSLTHISQIQLIYKATLEEPTFSAGPESAEVELFEYEDVPWDDLAFPSVKWALAHARARWTDERFAPFGNPD
ncbi:MAG: NUDIX hydrolase [Pseudomonadota bacterium]